VQPRTESEVQDWSD